MNKEITVDLRVDEIDSFGSITSRLGQTVIQSTHRIAKLYGSKFSDEMNDLKKLYTDHACDLAKEIIKGTGNTITVMVTESTVDSFNKVLKSTSRGILITNEVKKK